MAAAAEACAARAGTAAAPTSPRRPSRRSRRPRAAGIRVGGGASVARCQVGARRDHLVVAGEVALHEVARRLERGGAPVEAAEQQLDDAACDLCRQHTLAGAVERADVERARVTQRSGGGRRRERLVHVHEVELGVVEEILDRARHVDRQRHRPGPPRRRERDRLPDSQHLRASLRGEDGLGILGAGLHDLARGLDQLARIGRRDHHDTVPARAELIGQPLDVAVHLVVLLPRVRRDLGNGKTLRWHEA